MKLAKKLKSWECLLAASTQKPSTAKHYKLLTVSYLVIYVIIQLSR